MLAGQQAYRQYCRREKEIQRQCPVAEKPPQSPGVTAANFSAKFFAKFFGESWVAFHGTDFLGDAPLGPPPDLEVDLIRLTTSGVTHDGTWPTSTPSSPPWTGSTPWSPRTILARANFSSASRGCRRCWPTSNGHASTPRRKRPPERIDRLCETIEELTAERGARFSGPPSWEAGPRPPPPASNLVAAMSSAARQAQPPAEMIKNTVACW
jgi:hypothetical protein